MSNFIFRKAGLQDLHTLVEMRIDFLVELLGEQPVERVHQLKSQLKTYFQNGLQNDTYICYLAIQNEEVVGIGGMVMREQPGNFKNPSGKAGYLMNMYTVPHFRRQGICGQLVEKLMNEGKNKGITAYELHATKTGEQVYIQHGFGVHSEPTYRQYLNP